MDRRRRNRVLVAVAAGLGILIALVGVAISGDDDAGRCTVPAESPSLARMWNEATLSAIRRDNPEPTVHARNLFHLSAVMWDTWAAYEPGAASIYSDLEPPAHDPDDVDQARADAIAHAAHRLLTARYRNADGRVETLAELDALLVELCGSSDTEALEPDTPSAFGMAVADRVLDATFDDGALERLDYVDTTYTPVNVPLDPSRPGTTMADPNRWQPLRLATAIAQNDLPLPGGPQAFIGPHWGHVDSFALPDGGAAGLPLDPGPPPLLGSESDLEFRQAIVEVIAAAGALGTGQATIDLSPGARGANPLGSNDGTGHATNPVTGKPYEPNVVDLGDYGRVIAEYWADGPESETPPGHWNVIANEVSDRLDPARLTVGGSGVALDRLHWDLALYVALNGAMHDAAIAAWGAKGHYDYARPISMIRHAGGSGQSSDQGLPSYHPEGLLLSDGLIELITLDSSAPGERHAHLVEHVGEVAVRGWRGAPDDPAADVSGVGWVRAVEWVPYQRPTFVTPSFAAYVSGHSTFSRAAAEVLTAFTGSPAFPGGLWSWTVEQGTLLHEEGPTRDVTLQWATYADAADEAGLSRIYGGIHVPADDIAGRLMGAEVGRRAFARALELY